MEDIKYYHVWENYFGAKRSLFVTNNDKVYGINILSMFMTSSEFVSEDNIIYLVKSDPIEIKKLSDKKIKEFHIGEDFILALSEDNKLYSLGYNDHGKFGKSIEGNKDIYDCEIFHFKNSHSKIKQICVYYRTIMVLHHNGKVVVWGNNEFLWSKKSRFPTNIFYNLKEIRNPIELNSLNEIIYIYMTSNPSFAIDENNNVFSWGENDDDHLGHKNLEFISKPKISKILSNLKIITIKSYEDVTYLLSSDGKLYICGKDCESCDSIGNEFNFIQIESNEYFIELEKLKLKDDRDLLYFDGLDPIVALSYEQIVYELNGKELIETQYKSIEEYSVMKCKITYKTFVINFKDSGISLTQQIGKGGFGRVYKVFFQTRHFSIKKIAVNEDTKNYLEMNRELQIMKQLKSDFVVKLYDYWIKSENNFEFLYIQMELCDQTLKDIIEMNKSINPKIDYLMRTEILRQLLLALNYMHSMTPKVIHRDIKPSGMFRFTNPSVHKPLQFTNLIVYNQFTNFQFTNHFSSQTASVHKPLQFTNCFSSQTASVHKLLQFTNCFSSQTASVHKLLQFTNCFSSQTASVHKLLNKIIYYLINFIKLIKIYYRITPHTPTCRFK